MMKLTRYAGLLLTVACVIARAQTMSPNTNTTPQSAQVSQAFGTSLGVTVQDAGNNPMQGVVVTFSAPASGASGTFADTQTNTTTAMTDVNGVATAAALTANATVGGPYGVVASANGLPSANFALTNTAGPPTQMTANLNTTPQSAQVSQAFGTSLGVTVQDAGNNPVQGVAVTFTAPASGASGTFGDTQTNTTTAMTDVNGVATATAFTANATVGGPYNVTASATGPPPVNFALTNTGSAPSKLAFTTQPPSNGTAGVAFSAVVQVQDSNGNLVSNSNAAVTIASTPAGLASTTVNAVNGVATFSSLTINAANSYTLMATSDSLTSAISTSITVGAASASQMVLTTQPSNGTAGQALTPAVVVQIEDAFNNVVNSNAQVAVASNPPGATAQMNAAAGVATFANLIFDVANTYTLTATSGSLTSSPSNQFTISAGSGNQLAFTVQPPGSGIAGQALNPAVVVQVQDANGNLVTNSTVSVSIGSTPAAIGGTLTVNASGGIATFNNLVFTTTGNYTLTATSTGLSNATSTSVAIGPASAANLAFTVQPSSGTAGQALSPAVAVQVQDANGNLVTGSSGAVTISSVPTGAGGTSTVNAVGGIATFSNLVFTAANNYTLTAASPDLTYANSNQFTISAGSGNQLAFTVQPLASGTAGEALSPAMVVQVQDANGNLVTNSTAAVSIGSTPPGIGGMLTVNASGGIATFSNLMFTATGNYALTATSTGLSNATSTSVTIGPGSAANLAFTVQPSSGTAGQALSPAVAVQVEDANGNLVTGSSAAVTISSTPTGMGGTLTVNAVGGIATFGGLSFTAANNYTLTAASPSLTSGTSNQFTISSGSGNKLAFTVQPPASGAAGQALSPAIVVQVQDANGNLVTSSTVSISIGSTPAGIGGTLTANASGGIATFSNLVFTATGTYTLTATSTGLSNATSTSVAIGSGSAANLAFMVQPSSGTAGQALSPAVAVQVQDANGNLVTGSSAGVTISSVPTGVDGTLTVNAVGGIATFSGLSFAAANNYALTAASPSLTSANSSSFTISAGSGNKLAFTVQPPASGTAGQALSPAIVVQVQDANGNLVRNSTAVVRIGSTPSGVGGTLTVNASGGMATFSNLVFTATGNYALTATSTGLSNATSTSVAIGPGSAAKLAFTVQPSSGTAGQALSPAVAVQVQDAKGNLVTGSSTAVTISSTPTGVGGTLIVNAVGGIATFSSLSFTASNNYTLTAASQSLTSANSSSFTISAGSGNKLAFTVQPPASGTAGQPLSPAIVVQIQDSNGNLVTNSTAAVRIGSTQSGVGGKLTINAAGGIATFSNLVFTATGNYTLTATSTGLSNATSTSVEIGPGPAAKLAFTVQPSSGTAGQALAPGVVVQIEDGSGNLVTTSTAPVSISSAPSGVGGTATVNAVGGIATFSNLVFTTAGNYTLTGASTGLSSVSSNSFTISPGSGNKLVFATQPSATGTAGQALSPAVVVQIHDANGNLVTGSTSAVSISVTLAVTSRPLTTQPTATVNAVGGIATFNNLIFTTTGSYTLTATATGLANATSTPVAIAPGLASNVAFTVQPSSGTAGQALSPAVVVQVQDANGNLATSSTAGVLIASTPAGVGGTLTVNASGGIATFGNLSFTTAANYTLTATSTGLTPVNSNPFTIAAGAPGGTSAFSGSGQRTPVLKNFANPLVAIVRDSTGNPVPNITVTFTAPAGGPSGNFASSGIVTAVTGVNGRATSPAFTANSVAGTYNVTASAASVVTTATFAMTNVANLAIVTSMLSNATISAAYNQPLAATGGTPPYVWSLSAGALPAGLSLSSTGVIAGTPTASGEFAFTAHVSDSAGGAADQALTLTVVRNLAISTCPASTGIAYQPYSSAGTATGGQAPYTWSFTTGAFPPGLSLNALTGTVAGSPTSSGTFTVTLVVTDKSQATASLGCGFTIAPALAIITTAVSDASQSAPYSQTFLAIGGKRPYTWAISAGAPPPGLALSATGTLSGTPTQTGVFGFTVAVTDSTSVEVQRAYTMNVFAGLVVGACPQNVAEAGFPYSSTLTGEGGLVPYAWSVAGSLPGGLQLNASAGTISGTPQQVGSAALNVTVTDRSGLSGTKACSISVQPATAISTVSLSGGSTGVSYSEGVTVSGGVSPYVYSTTAGSLPPGLAIDAATGLIAGRPISSGAFAFTVQVTDNLGAQATKNLSINVTQGLTIPNCPAAEGSVGQPYSSPLVAQGGTTPYVWSISSGSLPPGLGLQSAASVTSIAGSPTQPGTSSFVLQATDAASGNVTRACSIQINSAPLTITTPSLPTAFLGVSYSEKLTATGGVAPYVWSIAGSGAPPAFSIGATGVLGGVPSTVGTYTFTVQVTDQVNDVAQQSITITVQAGTAPDVAITGLPSDIVSPDTQQTFGVQLAGSYPAPINGTVTLAVIPDPAIGLVDPSIQFATGGQTLNFTVAANSTTPVFAAPVVALQTGTVAATIQLSVKLESGGIDITPPNTPVSSIRVDRLAPVIVSITATQSASGIQVQIVGYSTTRDMTEGAFQFSTSGGAPLSTTVSLSGAASAWFPSPQSTLYGGQFTLTQPFTIQGTVGTLTSVTATLSNAQGTSAPATASFQ